MFFPRGSIFSVDLRRDAFDLRKALLEHFAPLHHSGK
jgi:hypothetical protein